MASRVILIAHPSQEKLEKLSEILSMNNFIVLTCSTPKDGFDIARRKKPHLIISAHQAEVMDGIDFCFMIRNHPRLASTPFLLYVNYIPWNDRINAYRVGVNDIITEAVRTEEFIERVNAQLIFYEILSQNSLKGNQSLIGKLEDFKLPELIQMLNLNQKSGILTIYHDISDGQIAFTNGEMTFALVQSFTGEEAVSEMLSWRRGVFVFETDVIETEKNIEKPTMQLLLDISRKFDEISNEDSQ